MHTFSSGSFILCLALVLLGACPAALRAADEPSALAVVSNFPGGSARVESIDQKGRTIRVAPAPHTERGWVCWWYFKVQGIQPGETLTLEVAGGSFALPDRAMVSLDNKKWTHTAPGQRQKDRVTYQHKVETREAWFAWGPPYVLATAREAVERAAKDSPHATAFELCKSRDGHSVPALRIAQKGVPDAERLGVWVHARQHAWEAGSSWVCQGVIDWLISEDPRAEALRRKASVTIVPIMDVDNVERGAGGKNQKPHDHNRDWSDKPVWPEVEAAIKQLSDLDRAGRIDLFIDLHNPGALERAPYFYLPAKELLNADNRRNIDNFLAAARAEITGPLKLAPKPRDSGPAYDVNWQRISGNWVAKNARPHVVPVCLETAWNTPNSTSDGYQRVGKELGLAIERYLRDPVRPAKP